MKYSDLTGHIIGAAMEVHSYLGCGFQEVIYQRALSYEMQLREIPHQREVEMDIFYKEKNVGTRRVDFLVYDKISVEIKAVSQMEPAHMTQAINYLEAYNLEIGLLINFGETKLKFHRVENRKLS
ncbi:MAG: GxxExxY protein [Leptospiraceae bacterium]|nr:GxxExxY protein [Leptospiraceae bacterium]